MDTLPYDPRTKSIVKDALFEFLYSHVTRQFRARIETLITRNTMIGGFAHKHFVYRGVIYNGEITVPPLRKNRLVPQLRVDMEDYLKDQDALNQQEVPLVLGFINQVLNSSNDLTDYLRVLPESVHQPLQHIIGTCHCRTTSLSEAKVEMFKDKHKNSIEMIKQRLASNLLI